MVGVELFVLTFCVVLNSYRFGRFAEHFAGVEVMIGVAATLYATMQWIWLRRRMSHALWWIPATVLGWYLAQGLLWSIGVALGKLDPKNTGQLSWGEGAILFCLGMTGLSLPQWFLMRRQFQRSFYWIIARPLAWLVGWGFLLVAEHFGVFDGGFIQPEYVFHTYVGPIAAWSFCGALFGLGFAPLAGAMMVWITRDASLNAV
jgi:hypothetical protein